MWRRPRLQTLFKVMFVVVLCGHLILQVLDKYIHSGSCINLRNEIQSRDHLSQLTSPEVVSYEHTTQRKGNRRKLRIDPNKFRLVSELNSTVHVWPWPETQTLLNVCYEKDWYNQGPLPNVSIIVSFHNNENIFNILHTLHAIVKHSPDHLLQEIILIDDNTFKDEFLQLLESYLGTNFGFLVRLFRSNVDLGLIRARLDGIRASKAPVVIVMDSHVEPQKGWLEPLLYEIVKDKRTLASPFLDWIQKPDRIWYYRHGASTWKTYFDWTFTFGFQAMSPEFLDLYTDHTQPVRSAVTVGTVWAMNKNWFEEVGAFDEGMLRWGGENIDLAVRVWLFGGRVVNIPCSHAAHLEKEGSRDYRNSWTEIIHKNYKRFAEVWLDDYTKYFYQHLPHIEGYEVGDLSSRLEIKSRALHNFTWFLNSVFPELGVPDVNVYAYGGLQSFDGGCIDSMYSMKPVITDCRTELIATQGFYWNKKGLIRMPMNIFMAHGLEDTGYVAVYEYTGYHNSPRATKWFHVKDGPVIETSSGLCLEAKPDRSLHLTKCQAKSLQYWSFHVYTKDYNQLASSALPQFKQYIPLLANRLANRLHFSTRNKEIHKNWEAKFQENKYFMALPRTIRV